MTVSSAVLRDLRAAGVAVEVVGDRLRLRADTRPSDEFLRLLREHKGEVLDLLRRRNAYGALGRSELVGRLTADHGMAWEYLLTRRRDLVELIYAADTRAETGDLAALARALRAAVAAFEVDNIHQEEHSMHSTLPPKEAPSETTSQVTEDDSVVAGFTARLNEESKTPVEGFLLTRYELKQLVSYYRFLQHRLDFLGRCGKVLSQLEIEIRRFATRRLEAISQAVGEEVVAAVASPMDDWWAPVLCWASQRLNNCENCRTPMRYIDVVEGETGLCLACRDRIKKVSEELGRAANVPARWSKLVEIADGLERSLNEPSVDWKSTTGSAADAAIPFVNSVLREFPPPEATSDDPARLAIHRFMSVLRQAFIHDASWNRPTHEREMPLPTSGKLADESPLLAPMVANGFVIGMVAGVNDRSAVLVDGFQPVEYELTVLADHYYEGIAEIDYEWRVYGQTGSTEIRFKPFAHRRIARITDAIGDGKVEEALSATVAKWQREFDRIDEEERSLPPCRNCGGKRTIAAKLFCEEGCCGNCASGSADIRREASDS